MMPLRTTIPTAPLFQVLTQGGIAQIRGAVLKVLRNEQMTEEAHLILGNHQPEPLPEDVLEDLWRIVRRAETGLRP